MRLRLRGISGAAVLASAVAIYALGAVPLALYYVYTRYSGLAAREYNVVEIGPRISLECLLVITATILLLSWQTRLAIGRRCRRLRLPVPGRGEMLRHALAAGAGGLFFCCWCAGLFVALCWEFAWGFDNPSLFNVITMIAGQLLLSALLFAVFCALRKAWRRPWVRTVWRWLALLLLYAACLFFAAFAQETPITNSDPLLRYIYNSVVLLLMFTVCSRFFITSPGC